jgi:hypothetical protein
MVGNGMQSSGTRAAQHQTWYRGEALCLACVMCDRSHRPDIRRSRAAVCRATHLRDGRPGEQIPYCAEEGAYVL